MQNELNPKSRKIIILIGLFSGILFLVGLAFDIFVNDSNSSQEITFNDYEDCGTDTAKWRLVYYDFVDAVCEDFSDGLWNSEPEYGGWVYKRKEIDKYVDDNIALPEIIEKISLIRRDSYDRLRKIHNLNTQQESIVMNKLELEWR